MVFIEDIADKMEEASEDWIVCLKKSTGEFVEVPLEYSHIAEEIPVDEAIPDRYQDWEKEFIQAAIDIEENWLNYVALPNQYDIHEYSIMENFIGRLSDNRKRAILDEAILGRGAFRRFKDKVYNLDLEEAWFHYKYEVYYNIAKRWCEENQIEYTYK